MYVYRALLWFVIFYSLYSQTKIHKTLGRFTLKKNLKSLTYYSYLIQFVVIYTGSLYAS